MSHELEIKKDGAASMFYVGETPWHSLGRRLDNPPTVAEGLTAAGLDWTVSVHPMEGMVKTSDGEELRLKSRMRMVVRDSDNKRLSEVGPEWTPLQNKDAFEWFQPFIDSKEASLETAGSLFDGEKIWVLARLNRDPMVIGGNDIANKYLFISNAHSDKASVRPCISAIRCVCWNTVSMAHSDKATKSIKIRHSAKVKMNLDSVREIINAADATFEATAEQYRALTRKHISSADLKKYVKLVFKQKEDADEDKVVVRKIQEDDQRLIENKIMPLFEGGRGSNLPTAKGTLFGAYMAVNEWLNWERGRTTDSRLDNLWFGPSKNLDIRAMSVALDML